MNVSNRYISQYEKLDFLWYERDGLIIYIDGLKHFMENPDQNFKNIKMVNIYNVQIDHLTIL